MAGGGTAMLSTAHDDDKQLLAKPAIPQLTTDATRHMRALQGLSGADISLSCPRAGRKELQGGPDHPNHNQIGLNKPVGPANTLLPEGWAQNPGSLSPFFLEPSRGATSGKSQGTEKEAPCPGVPLP